MGKSTQQFSLWWQRWEWPSVSVNVPHFSVPPEEMASGAGSVATFSDYQTRRSLPKHSRNIFITYSSDLFYEMIGFVDVLSKHGFQATMDTVDRHLTNMNIITGEDSFIKDPSTFIIVAISPRYKLDIERCVGNSCSLHTKSIHSMMQLEFIQQGSLNFRFIPVLFLDACQEDIPGWLQNTHVYRWPLNKDDLLLRLLKEERFIPPPVPVELSVVITPVAAAPSTSK
ncbi:E3 ubiquitin ligase TRAF3IP2-like [Stigmatopora nigra]